MARYRSICALFFFVSLVSGTCFAESYRSYDELSAVAIVISDHAFATFAGARAIVESAGAYGVQMFPPDAIFGYFPVRPDPSRFAELDVELCFARVDLMGKGLDGIVQRVVGDLFDQKEILRAAPLEEAAPLEDRLLRVPEEIVRATMPVGDGPRRGSPRELADRSIRENSEFLVGSVLVNIIFPESAGSSEDWTDQEIAEAVAGIALGISQYVQRTLWFNDLSFMYNYNSFKRVPVSMEPIESNMDIDYIWIGEALLYLGYPNGAYMGAHALNNATRKVYKTDWVFTAFIADMSNHYSEPVSGCWGGAGYVAYAYLGGPYLLVPYPACRYGYGLGFGRVFIHEMSHTFWALDEYASAAEGCDSRSGYLAVANRNTLYNSCQETVPCIMQSSSPPFTEPQPVCDYTEGQVGISGSDINGTTYLDVYSAWPRVSFYKGEPVGINAATHLKEYAIPSEASFSLGVPGVTDTIMPGDEYYLGMTIINDAVPNRNPMQAEPPDRVDYAPYIKGGWISINKMGWRLERSSDGMWGHTSSEMVLPLDRTAELEPGLNTIDFRAENRVGLCDTASMNLFLIGLSFRSVFAIPAGGGIRVAWTTAREVFNATFDVMRKDLTTGGAEELLATVSTPDGIGSQRAYSYVDTAVQPTHEYRYRLDGKFRYGKSDYVFSSHDASATASVPIGKGIVSNLLPNPTRDRVMFTVNVPKSRSAVSGSRVAAEEGGASSAGALGEVRTRVDISVYDVLGRRIKSIYSNSVFSGIMTLAWDGTDSYRTAVPSGVYFLRVIAGNETAVRKVVILR